jgi:hypothetical protein
MSGVLPVEVDVILPAVLEETVDVILPPTSPTAPPELVLVGLEDGSGFWAGFTWG